MNNKILPFMLNFTIPHYPSMESNNFDNNNI